jgi:excisionase family DNA binding protein
MPTAATAPQLADEYLTAKQAAAALHLTDETLYKMIKAGELPARRIGRKWHISRRALESRLTPPEIPPPDTPATGPAAEDAWLAETLAKFTPDDLRRAGKVLRAIADAATSKAGAA